MESPNVDNGSLEVQNSSNYNETELFTNESAPVTDLVFPAYIRIVSTSVCSVVFAVGVVGNLLVPLVLIKNKDMRNSTNYFLLNLSLADLLILLICLPSALVELSSPPEVWLLGETMCKTVKFLEYAVSHLSILSLMAISLERYYVVCHPLQVSYVCTKSRTNQIVLLIWSTAFVTASPTLWIQTYEIHPYYDNSMQPFCLMKVTDLTIAFIFTVSVLFFFIPLLLLVSVYSVIARQLLTDPMRLNPERNNPQMRARKQVVVMLATVVLFFFLCLLPMRVFFLWILVVSKETILSMGIERYYNLVYFCRVMYYLNSSINPILYAFMSSRFRSEFLRVLLGGRIVRVGTKSYSLTSNGGIGSYRGSRKSQNASFIKAPKGQANSRSSSSSAKLIRSSDTSSGYHPKGESFV